MRTRLLALAVVVVLASAAAVSPDASAQRAGAGVPATLPGAWRSPHPDAHGIAVVRAAIEPHLAGLPPLIGPIVRARLEERTRIVRRIDITTSGPNVRVVSTGERTFTVDTALGVPTPMTSPEGRAVTTTQQITGGWLEQVFRGENGDMRVLYSTEPEGRTMHVDVTLSSERLSSPIRYRLDYVRAE
jgi:hypothetical protein